MWNNKQQTAENDDDSWEVRAFEEDTTGNLLGCTWPPRSYTCTFCRREFRSAQALGGHMNVHRRDRARMHDPPPLLLPPSPTASNKSPLLIPTQDLLANGLCILYTLPNPNSVLNPNPINGTMDSHSSPLLSIVSPFTTNIRSPVAHDFGSSLCHSRNNEPLASNNNIENDCMNVKDLGAIDEELDLELRLGPKSTSPVEGSR